LRPVDPLPVLMYHGIVREQSDLDSLCEEERPYALPRDLFQAQLSALLADGWAILGDLEEAFRARGRRLLLTFDDTLPTHRATSDLVSDMGLRALFHLTTASVDAPGRLSGDDVSHIAERGMLLASHGHTHQFLSLMSPEELERLLTLSRQRLDCWPGSARPILSVPGGRYNTKVLRAARGAGFERVMTSEPKVCDADQRPFRIGRLNVTAAMKPGGLVQAVEAMASGRRGGPWRRAKNGIRVLLGDGRYDLLWKKWHCRR